VEIFYGHDFELTSSQRFKHSLGYLNQLSLICGFKIHESLEINLRKENEEYVPGLVVLLSKP